MAKASRRQIKWTLFLMILLIVLAITVSIYTRFRQIDEGFERLAVTTGRQVFNELVNARAWNASHGGVYVPITEDTQPNPYLKDALRDVVTTDGLNLTKINPAYMTRSIAEFALKERKVRVHITSLNLIRPENEAFLWEKNAMEMFEQGKFEYDGIDATGDEHIFRYMAPLVTEKACLKCHAAQGYAVGDIRGGISVSFSYKPYMSEIALAKKNAIITHLGFALLSISVILFLGKRLFAGVVRLEQEIYRLEGLLPICMYCKKIKVEGGDESDRATWHQIEKYITERSEAVFSHGICPECREIAHPGKGSS